jgi:ADP-ribose pyrophosphatase
MKIEKLIKRSTHFKGKVFNIHVDQITNHQGQNAQREVLEHLGGVCVLATTGDYLYLIKQYRHAIGDFLIEAPAGRLEFNEAPDLAANRELKEETGLSAKTLISLGYLYPTPGYSTEKIHLYLAKDLSMGQTDFDQDEWIETFKITYDEALEMIHTGKITDAKTIVLILRAHLLERKQT